MASFDRDVINVEELRDFAAATARAAAARIRTQRAALIDADGLAAHTQTKSSAVDPVTEVDQATERFITEQIVFARPGDGILGEEGADVLSSTGITWIVDPIDGTVNFLYGINEYAVSIGAAVDGEIVAGAVINVVRGDLYSAALGHGATLETSDGTVRKLHCRTETDPALALVATGFGYAAGRRQAQAELLCRLLPQVRDIRRMGAAALDLCRVAEGSVDAYYEHGINAWDCAAGAIIAAEAGAVVNRPGLNKGAKDGELTWACGGSLASAFSQLLEENGALEPLRG